MSDDEDCFGEEDNFSDDNFSDDNFSDDMGGDENDGGDDGEKMADEWYYEGKDHRNSGDFEKAKECFVNSIEAEKDDPSEYGFKSHKRIVMMMVDGDIAFDEDELTGHLKKMMTFSAEFDVKTIEKIMDTASKSKKDDFMGKTRWDLIIDIADLCASGFWNKKNERSWFRAYLSTLKVLIASEAKSLLSEDQRSWVSAKLTTLMNWCEIVPGLVNSKKESFLLEVLSVFMKRILLSIGKDRQISDVIVGKDGLRRLVSRAINIHADILGLDTFGTINECCGYVMLFEHKWSDAKQKFFEGFKNYDDSASPRRLPCLRYFVLASMLENSGVNPFETREIKSLSSHEEILPVARLWSAFENRNVSEFNTAVQKAFEKDVFARSFVPIMTLSFQRLKIAELIQAYSRVRISFIAQQLQISEEECKSIITQLVLDGRLSGCIDQTKMVFCVEEEGLNDDDTKYTAMHQWSKHIETVAKSINRKMVDTTRGDRGFRDFYDDA